MGKAKYTGQLLEDLLGLSWPEFHKKYPDILYNTWKGKRSIWKRKAAEGKLNMENEPTKSWEVAAFNRETNEWETTTLHSYDHTEADYEAFIPATPAKITPSRRKPVERDHDLLFVFSDLQYGDRDLYDHRTREHTTITSHDTRMMRLIRLMCSDLRPSHIINDGDTGDFSSVSRWKQNSNQFMNELGDTFQGIHNFYAGLRSDNPQARIIEVSSNHNQRFDDTVRANFPQMWNVYRPGSNDKYPLLSYPSLANLEHVGVEWYGGYPSAEYVHGEEYGKPPIVFRHGMETGQKGTVLQKIIRNHPDTHNVHGHAHTVAEARHTKRDGTMLGSFVVGASCRTTGEVDSYHSSVTEQNQIVPHQENWQQGVLIIRDFKNGEYEFNQVIVRDGKAYFEGKEYDGNE